MPNLFTQLIQDRLIKPQVESQLAVAKANQPVAYGAGMMPEVSLDKAIGQPHDTNYALLYALYKLNTDVSGCVHKWAGGITGPGWRVTTMSPDTELTDTLKAQMTDIERWIKNPNPSKLFSLMLYELVQHLAIVGDTFWYISKNKRGRPLEIWPMHPALVRIVATRQGEVLGYVMRVPGDNPVTFAPDEVLHFALPNPGNDLYGEAPLELVVEEAGIDLQALRSNKANFQNGLNPSAVILMDDKASPAQATEVTERLKAGHTGASQQHKLLALAQVKDFKPWTMSLRDLEYSKLRDLATSKVTTAYRIPKVLLGHHNAGDYATTKFLIRDTYLNTYQPIQGLIAEIITERLIHLINPELKWELNTPDASDPDDIRKDQIAAKAANILTSDEVRHDSFGKEPLPKVSANQPATTTTPATDTGTQPTAADQQPDPNATDTAQAAPGTTKRLNKALDSTQTDPLAIEREQQLNDLAGALEPAVGQFFTTQQQDYLDRLSGELNAQKLLGYVAATAAAQDTQLHMLLFGLLVASLNAGAEAAQLQIGISLTFDQTNPAVQTYVNTQALQHAQGINTTTREAIKTQLSEGLKAGEGIPELSQRIEQVFIEAKGYRAQLIARSETAQAFAYANYEALKATGVVTHRRWITSERENVCPICQPLNGYTIRFEAQYPDGAEPGSVHPQCACSEIGLTEDQL